MTPFRIAVDAHRLVCEPRTSGSTYLGTLLREWERIAPDVEVVLLVPSKPGPEAHPILESASPRRHLATPGSECHPARRFRSQVHWQQVVIPSLLRQCQPHIYFSPFHLTPFLPLRVRMVTTIHDLCFLCEPVLSAGSLIHRAQAVSACVRARKLICVS